MNKLNSKELRISEPSPEQIKAIRRTPIYFILDKIIDTYNIGSLFRLADAIAIEKMYLCGEMDFPPSSRIHKAAVGTENWVPWEKVEKTSDIVTKLHSEGVQIIAVEQSQKSVPYNILTSKVNFPIAIVCGNETEGISKEVLDLSDLIVELPMLGINKSFNVWGSTAVVAYFALTAILFPVKRK